MSVLYCTVFKVGDGVPTVLGAGSYPLPASDFVYDGDRLSYLRGITVEPVPTGDYHVLIFLGHHPYGHDMGGTDTGRARVVCNKIHVDVHINVVMRPAEPHLADILRCWPGPDPGLAINTAVVQRVGTLQRLLGKST